MEHADEFSRLLERASQGCPEAIGELHQRYGGHIRKVVREWLNPRLRPLFDSLDFQQDVWASFFCSDLKRCCFTNSEELTRFLCKMAKGKVVDVIRQRLASPRYDLKREQSLDQLHFVEVAPEVAARNPSASQLAMANEKWQELIQKQPAPNRRILELLRAGHTHEEIAKQTGFSTKTVQRFIQSLRKESET